jgi:membrane-bound lytic murein transglycosylase D
MNSMIGYSMAALNCGEGRVRRLLREKRADTTLDSTRVISYWDLELPKETMHYVPRILAAMVIGHYPEHYDMLIEPQERVPFDTITIFDCLPLDLIAKTVGVSEDSIRSLNPELIKSFTHQICKILCYKASICFKRKFCYCL